MSELALAPRTHIRPRNRAITLEDLRQACVDGPGECWLWQRALNPSGYAIGVKYRTRKWRVHRLAWTLANGEIPDGLVIDHLCFVRNCINPDHLRLDTRSHNSSNRRNVFGDTCNNGHLLTPENVRIGRGRGGKPRRYCLPCRAEGRY